MRKGSTSRFAYYGIPKQARASRLVAREYRNGDMYGDDWETTRRAILVRDRYTCQDRRCGVRWPPPMHGKLHVHHVQPLSRGGTNAHSNLLTLCHPCHRRVHEEMDAKRTNRKRR